LNFIRSSFRTIRQTPALIFAEIAWRWAFGATAWLLVVLTVRMIMEGIEVTGAEAALARSKDAYLIADAAARVLIQVLPRLAHAFLILVPLLSLFWIAAATLGRSATLRNLTSDRSAGFQPAVPLASSRRLVSLVLLSTLRAVFTLATVLAFFGTVFLVSAQAKSPTTPEVAPALLLAWLCLAFFVGCLWGLVNWFLALAPIFIVGDGLGVWKAISASLGLYRDKSRDYLAIASWFGFFRGSALAVAIVAGFLCVAAGLRAGLIASAAIALAYFAVADWLYITRLAAYVELAGSGPSHVDSVTVPNEPPTALGPAQTETETETHSGLS
jgi:hypothetical protein